MRRTAVPAPTQEDTKRLQPNGKVSSGRGRTMSRMHEPTYPSCTRVRSSDRRVRIDLGHRAQDVEPEHSRSSIAAIVKLDLTVSSR